jgi:hypothetical protein
MSRSPAARPTRAPASAGARVEVPLAWSVAPAAVFLLAYLALTPAVSGDKDSAEFVLVLATGGVAHPTGYPLFTLLGHVWTRALHALGLPWAYAANAFSALGGAVALLLLHRLSLALLPRAAALDRNARAALALLPVALLAFDPLWTYETTLAEVYAWHVAWALGLALLTARGLRALAAGALEAPGALLRGALAWGLVCGAGGAHHASALLTAVPCALALGVAFARRGRPLALALAGAVLGALPPLATYGLIAWRASHPARVQWGTLVPGGVRDFLTAADHAGRFGGFAPGAGQARQMSLLLWPLLALAVAALAWLAWRARDERRAVAETLAGAVALGLAAAFAYGVPDPASYFLAPLALALAAVPAVLAAGTGERRGLSPRARGVALAGGALALALWVPWIGEATARNRDFVGFDRMLADMWRAVPFERGVVCWADDMSAKLRERQLLGGEKPELTVLDPLFACNPAPRARLARELGVDALAGLDPDGVLARGGEAALADSVEARVNARTTLPVLHFDPHGELRLLVKPDGSAPAGMVTTPR